VPTRAARMAAVQSFIFMEEVLMPNAEDIRSLDLLDLQKRRHIFVSMFLILIPM
jgi:hypothetical protein